MEQVFPEGERKVFAYFDGARTVYADPLQVLRRWVLFFDGDPNPTHEAMYSDEPMVRLPAQERVVAGVRAAFDMAPFDPATGAGATDADCLAALRAWEDWLAAKKAPAAS